MAMIIAVLASAALFGSPQQSARTELEAFADLCGALGYSGTMYVQVEGERLLEVSCGFADVTKGRTLEPDDAMEIASVTKLITATAIVRLHQEGRLSLGESIATYLPGVGDAHAAIEVRHLLSHSSGMARRSASGHGDDRAGAVAGYLRDAPATPPGTKSEYWNGGYALLAAIVEEVTGGSFEDHVRSRIFEPARMTSATFVGAALEPEDQAMGYELSSRSRWAAAHPYPRGGAWSYKGMGGVVCTARDLARLVEAFADARLVERSLVEEMTTAAFPHQGLGWKLAAEGEAAQWTHGGDVAGFHSFLQYLPGEEILVVVMGNRSGPPQYTIAHALVELARGNGQIGWFPKATTWGPSRLKALEGTWVIEGEVGQSVAVAVSDCVRMTPLDPGSTAALDPPSSRARPVDAFPPRAANAVEPEAFLRLVPVGHDELRSRPWKPTEMPHVVHVEREGSDIVQLRIERLRQETVVLVRR